MTGYNKTCADYEVKVLQTQNECIKAAGALDIEFKWNGSFTSYQYGCFANKNNHAYWNYNQAHKDQNAGHDIANKGICLAGECYERYFKRRK